jgi:hypothetical protein
MRSQGNTQYFNPHITHQTKPDENDIPYKTKKTPKVMETLNTLTHRPLTILSQLKNIPLPKQAPKTNLRSSSSTSSDHSPSKAS